MNTITNDKGERVPAVGAPGSIERARVQYPTLLDCVNWLYNVNHDQPSHRVDFAVEAIRDAGIRDANETSAILAASLYGALPSGGTAAMTIRQAPLYRAWEPQEAV